MIRIAGVEDIDTLLELNAVVQGWHAAHYPDRFSADPDSDRMRAFFIEMLQTDGCYILLEANGAGYLFAKFHAGKETPTGQKKAFLHIEHLAVRPERQRKGVGSALMTEAETLARDLDCASVTLDTWAANHSAHRMFEAMGMRPLRHHYSKLLD
ncbi:GNAT family N-acetyltransferase [Gymnodinialimonas sp. 2305UL16-5]|uniref:GNAT family N-acetyltransferase n=1 Tax=Gymnodinialimonas mytili TaxID=3126503 RepID=UPI0030A01DC8